MLVLSRRAGESIVIGGEVVVTIVEVRGGQVRIGIDAPRSVEVHREEVFRQVMQENIAAVESAGQDPELLRQVTRSTAPDSTNPPGEPSGP